MSIPLTEIGPMPPGDPAAMRKYATQLRSDATRLRAFAADLRTRVDGMPFTAPVAERVRAAVGTDAHGFEGCADGLESVATSIESSAGTVEDDQQAWRTQREKLIAENARIARGN